MKNKFASVVVLSMLAGSAQAGFLDFLFGEKTEQPVVSESSNVNNATEIKPIEVKPISKATDQDSVLSTETLVKAAQGLLPLLTEQLGVTNEQAEGGMGALLQTAQKSLSDTDFSSLSDSIPGIEGMLSAAPDVNSGNGESSGLSGLLSKAGSFSESLGSLGDLTKQFEALGLSPDMIVQFAQLAIEYLTGEQKEGEEQGEILQKGLSSVIGV